MRHVPPSDVRAYMIAIGPQHLRMAEETLPRVEKHSGVKVELLTEGNPFELKLKLLERSDSTVFFVDADAVMLDWSWEEFKLPGFNVCFDQASPHWEGYQHLATLFNPATSINTGMFLVSAEYRKLFKKAQQAFQELIQRSFPYNLGDQTALNWTLAERGNGTNLNILSQKYNWQTVSDRPEVPEGIYLVHLIGGTIPSPTEVPNLSHKLERVLNFCKRHPL